MRVKTTLLVSCVVIVTLAGCAGKGLGLDHIPITLGEAPPPNTGAMVGAYNLEDFKVSTDGGVSGTLHLLLTKPMVPEKYRDVLFVEAYATYSSSELRYHETIAMGDPVPILAKEATSDQVDFSVQGTFAIPDPAREPLPLTAMTFKMTWYRVATVTENGLAGYWGRLDIGQNTASDSMVGPFRICDTVDLVGSIDDNLLVATAHQRWIYENITLP